MRASRHLPAIVALLLAAGSGTAVAAATGEWISYRDAYRAMVVFEKYGKPKNFIQNHYQVMPREKGISLDGVQLSLQGKTMQVNLPLDPTGRTVFPFLKAAYDENAALVLNRKVANYVFRPRISIIVQADGLYETGDLRAACEQVLAWRRHVDATASAKKCVGVRFAFTGAGGEPEVRLRRGAAGETVLPAVTGAAFSDDPNAAFRVVNYRFADSTVAGQVVMTDAPLSIAALIE
ncbi:hypothetical protein ACFSQU_12650 [Massilia sp. GCM10020059]|uniref:DUF2987 domain-containing protein n=1 Tax=Massilia agrisoli TaxID=2892444 RepID=A0ABS8IVD6_9BURK|nr:hypothetical protein [Massilia agrisoli]MCC6072607.1 hypothetical protein [Massilia agrisoli]